LSEGWVLIREANDRVQLFLGILKPGISALPKLEATLLVWVTDIQTTSSLMSGTLEAKVFNV
jgi:hypothetical protein